LAQQPATPPPSTNERARAQTRGVVLAVRCGARGDRPGRGHEPTVRSAKNPWSSSCFITHSLRLFRQNSSSVPFPSTVLIIVRVGRSSRPILPSASISRVSTNRRPHPLKKGRTRAAMGTVAGGRQAGGRLTASKWNHQLLLLVGTWRQQQPAASWRPSSQQPVGTTASRPRAHTHARHMYAPCVKRTSLRSASDNSRKPAAPRELATFSFSRNI
jgi:hypothetical protein